MSDDSAPPVIEITREELRARRAECRRQLAAIRALPPEHEVLDRLDQIDFLLGEGKYKRPLITGKHPRGDGATGALHE